MSRSGLSKWVHNSYQQIFIFPRLLPVFHFLILPSFLLRKIITIAYKITVFFVLSWGQPCSAAYSGHFFVIHARRNGKAINARTSVFVKHVVVFLITILNHAPLPTSLAFPNTAPDVFSYDSSERDRRRSEMTA